VDANELRVSLETPLGGGEYPVSVLLFLPDGGVEVLVDSILEVVEADGLQWRANGLLQTSYRVAEGSEDAFDGIGRSTTKGSASYEADRVAGPWGLGAALDVLYDEAAPAGDDWLLPDVSLAATYRGETATTSVAAGAIDIAGENLLFSGFTRRGAMVASAVTPGRLEAQAFSVVSTPGNLIRSNQLLPTDRDQRSDGLTASMQLMDERLQLSGAFVDGRTPYGGAGFNALEDEAVYGGDSWNVKLASELAEGSVMLELERAESSFDADGIGLGAPARQDDATSALLVVSSMGALGSGPFSWWSAQLQHRRVGLDFYSVGNLGLPGNLELHSAYLQAGLRDLAIDLDVARERSNPDDDPLMPTQTLDRAGIRMAYAPGTLDPEAALWRWLGAPSANTWFYQVDNSQPDADAALAGFDVDNTTQEFGVGLAFSRDRLNWSLQLAMIDYDDRSEAVFEGDFLIYEPPSASRNLQASVQASWVPTERVTLDAYVQRNRLEETDFNNEYTNTLYGGGATLVLLPEGLNLRGNFAIGRDRSEFGDELFMAERLNSRFADLQLVWEAIAARPGRAGLSVNLGGSYTRNEVLALLADDEMWSVFLGARLNWAGSKQ
jgi:hypothetical protein